MSLQGMMRTSVSGMNAQANLLSSVSDNIANSSTTGYKESTVSFSSMVLSATGGNYASGSVQSNTSYSISQQGSLATTSSSTDLAITGSGFFVVQDTSGNILLTRDGSFTPNSEGELVNSSGYTLMGYPDTESGTTAIVNGFAGLTPVKVTQSGLTANASTTGSIAANLDSAATAVTNATTPADVGTTSGTPNYTSKTSVVAYDSLGNQIQVDVYYTKTADNTWQVAAFNHADADSTSGSFPYTSGPLATSSLEFDSSTGKLSSTSPSDSITVPIPNGSTTTNLAIDLSSMTQYDYNFTVSSAKVNGNAPSAMDSVSIGKDGTVSAVYADGNTSSLYRIAMAKVTSPDKLTVVSGNAFQMNQETGTVVVGFAGDSNFGTITSKALEESNVDVATQLTNMIQSQRAYTANSKVFQTGSELMDTLVNLQR